MLCPPTHSYSINKHGKVFWRENEVQQIPGTVKSLATSLGTERSVSVLIASVSGKNSEGFVLRLGGGISRSN